MKVRTTLFLLSATFVILVAAFGLAMFYTFGWMNREISHGQKAHLIAKEIFELDIVTYETMVHQGKRMQQRWRLKYDSIGEKVEKMRKRETHPENLSLIESMITNYGKLPDLISRVQADLADKKRRTEENKVQAGVDIPTAIDQRPINEILTRTRKIASEAFELAGLRQQKIAFVQKRADLVIVFTMIGLIILLSYISFLTVKRLTGPINEFLKGAEIIGKGDLGYRIDLRTKNEMGQLANSFNKMAEDLRESTVSKDELEKEISQRKRTEKETREVKEQLEKLLDVSPAVIYTCEPRGDYPTTFVSGNVVKQLGYEPQHFIEDPHFFADHVHPEDAPRVFADLATLTGKDYHTHEYRFLHKDGAYRWMYDELEIVRDAGGDPLRIVGAMIDITGRKRAGVLLSKELTAITAVMNDMLRGDVKDSRTNERVLNACLTATDSIYGYIGVINEEGKFDVTAFCSQARDDCAFPEALSGDLATGMTLRGIWGWPMLHNEPLICNDFGAHPDRIGLPQGHIPLHCFLGIPLRRDGNAVGMVAVANKPTGYTEEDRDTLLRLASVMSVSRKHRAALLEAKRSSEELENLVSKRTKQLREEISERKLAEEKIKQYSENLEHMVEARTEELNQALLDTEAARDKMEGILKSVSDGLIVTDGYNRIVLMNSAAEDLLGVRLTKVIGRPIDFAIEEKKLREKVMETLDKKETGHQFDFPKADAGPAHPRIMRARTSVIHDRHGADAGIVTIIYDVTQEREMDRMKTEFISTAAHELRTPLTSIRGFSEMLLTRENLGDEEQKRFLTHINKHSVRLVHIINDLLRISLNVVRFRKHYNIRAWF